MNTNTFITIRTATLSDAQALLNIYAPYVEYTAITFEYDVPSVEEFAFRIKNTLQKYPYLVSKKHWLNLEFKRAKAGSTSYQ